MFSEITLTIAELLKQHHATVTVAESSTGGLISANLLSVAGASSYFLGGSVVYTLAARRAWLDLDRTKTKALKPMTEEMAQEFATAAQRQLDTTWGIAELGATGPAGTPYGHSPGTCVIGISGPIQKTLRIETQSNQRQQNMLAFTEAALNLFADTLAEAY